VLDPVVVTDATTNEPSDKPDSDGLAIQSGVRAVLEDLSSRPTRDPVSGKFIAGHHAAGNGTLQGSQAWLSAIEPLKDEIVEQLVADFGMDGNTAFTMSGLMDGFAEAHLLRKAMFIRMSELGGPITGKGKMRALYRAYLAALDREIKLAQLLGLERRPRQLPRTPSEALMQEKEVL
jgi:hypothetical protein